MEEQIVTKQKRPKRSEQLQVQLDKGDVGRFLRHALAGYNLPPIDISDIEQVKERCEWYFNHCIEDDVRPTVAGVSNALGINRKTFYEWCVGHDRSKTHCEYIQRVRNIMEEMMEGYMLSGKINPVSGIFLMKNNFGYTDKSEVVLTPNTPLGEEVSPEVLQKKYLTDVGYNEEDIAALNVPGLDE